MSPCKMQPGEATEWGGRVVARGSNPLLSVLGAFENTFEVVYGLLNPEHKLF